MGVGGGGDMNSRGSIFYTHDREDNSESIKMRVVILVRDTLP